MQHSVKSKPWLTKLKRLALGFDTCFEAFAITALTAMTLIVTLQIFTRKLANFVFFWSEEVTLLLLIWYGFMGIAIGFREHLHLSMSAFAKLLPPVVQRLLDKLIPLCIGLFGLYLIVYGWEFTVLMHNNRMPAMELPMSVQYVIIPITGFMTMVYSILQLFNINTMRHQELKEELPE